MLKFILALFLLALPAQAYAQTPEQADDLQERIKYATFLNEAWGIRDVIQKDIDGYAQRVDPADRDRFLRQVQVNIDFEALEELAIQEMAKIYTVSELKAMIAYYGSPEGKSAESKSDQFVGKMAPVVERALDKAMADAQFGPSE